MAPATKKKPKAGDKKAVGKKKPVAKKATANKATVNKATVNKATAKKTTAKRAATKPVVKAKRGAVRVAVPVAMFRKLGDMLERDGDAWQIQGLSEVLGELGPRAPAAAAAILSETRKGTPLARAYLTALGDGDVSEAANKVVQHCASMERGRKAFRNAFGAVWRKASDIAAIDAAVKNFSRAIIDDPLLLDAGVDAAIKLGDTASATALAARLERATRLAPLVEALAGAAPVRARAAKELAALAPHDRRQVYTRVIDNPRCFDEAIAVEAVCTLADDASVTDMTLSGAIADMRYHGSDKLIATWKPRIAVGDATLTMRLLGLFEWTALWATDDDQLKPYIHALYPASARPEVFGSVEHALAGNSMVAREAVLAEWLREAEGIRAFTDSQVDKLVRMAVTIAETGNDSNDRRAANNALFSSPHPGARHALMDAIRNASTAKNPDLRRNLYYGLSHSDGPELLPFLIERLFVEREEYGALLEALATKLDAHAHLRVLGILVERAESPDAVHAATIYADCLIAKKHSPRLLIDLARVVIGWAFNSNDDGRRLRYIFEQATSAALELSRPDDARAFLSRARGLPESPYSDYHVKALDQKTPTRLAAADVKKRIAALESGKLEQQIADARAAAERARAAGTPIAADDARLGILAGCRVTGRFFEDASAQVVWFFDEVGALFVYDGFAVVPPTFQVTRTGVDGSPNGIAELSSGHAMNPERSPELSLIDERALLLDNKGARVREVIRLGDRLLIHDGSGRDYWDHISVPAVGLKFSTPAEAHHTFARLVANPPKGTKQVDPWYVEGTGAVRRQYYCPLPGGDYNRDGEARLALLGRKIDGVLDERMPPLDRVHNSADAAMTAMEAWETRVLATGGRIAKLWIDAEATRPEDTLLVSFLDQRCRDDEQGAAWHLQSLGEMLGAVAEAGLTPLVPDVHVALGPPANATDIAAYQALVGEPLPAPLLEVWREVGGGGFTCPRVSIRLLAPAELVARRTELRDQLRTHYVQRIKGKKLAARLAIVDDLDVLALKDDEPLILFDTKQRNNDGRCFSSVDSDWWEKSLGWQIATDINVELNLELVTRLPDVYRLKLGQRPGPHVTRVALSKKPDKAWEAIVDGTRLLVRTTGKTFFKPVVKQLASEAAALQAFDAAVADAKKKGFR